MDAGRGPVRRGRNGPTSQRDEKSMVEHKGVSGGFGCGGLGLRAGRGSVTERGLWRRRILSTAICAAVERLESRCYFAALAGDPVVDAGKPYVLHLSPGYEATTTKYRVDWGDGTSTTTPDTAARTLTHEYTYDAQNPTRAPKVYRLDSGDNVVGSPDRKSVV